MDKLKRNFENYSNRHKAYLAFKALKKHPYWFEDDGIKAYFAVDFDEWIWFPESDNPACPVEWKKDYLGIDREV